MSWRTRWVASSDQQRLSRDAKKGPGLLAGAVPHCYQRCGVALMSMRSAIEQQHNVDDHGRPAGGFTEGRGFRIDWQNGPLAVDGQRREPNGAFVEDVIAAAIGRIEHYQASEFHGLHNAVALGHLYAAAEALAERTRDREQRGVEGTHQR